MSDSNNLFRQDAIDYMPFDENGVLVRDNILRQFGLDQSWSKRLSITNFAGARFGRRPIYEQEAREYSRLTNNAGFGAVYGGAPADILGLMSACTAFNEYLIGISPKLFTDKKGRNSGLSEKAVNITLDDFYPRKVYMDLLCHRFAVHPGGFGSLEEALEALIFSAKHGKTVDFLSIEGYWSAFVNQLHVLRDIGLIRDGDRGKDKDIGLFTVSPTAQIAFNHAERYFQKTYDAVKLSGRIVDKRKPNKSLQEYMRQNPHLIADHVFRFLSDEGKNAPRVGIVVSGNIRHDSASSRLNDRALTKEFCDQSERLGRELAQAGAVLVLAGGKYGLREIMAESALKEGGSVIWVQKAAPNEPIEVLSYGRELTFRVAREFEKAMLFDMISHSSGFLPGGINTMDRVFEIVTREQTGFGRYTFLADVPRHSGLRNPVLGYNLGRIWTDIEQQVGRFKDDGFIEEKDVDLFRMLDPHESLACELVRVASVASTDEDLLKDILSLPRVPLSDVGVDQSLLSPDVSP